MQIKTQPSRRAGAPKCIFSGPLQSDNVRVEDDGVIKICLTADDIYSKNAKQRYEIALTSDELRLLGAVDRAVMG